jgi:hypothetical protein
MSERNEQVFFEDEALDRAVGMIMTLAAELYITRDRCTVLERILAAKGIVDPAEYDAYEPDPETRRADAIDRDAFAASLLQHVRGKTA